jgi:hypothetical protein
MKLPGPHLAVAEWVPLMPAHAYRPVSVREQTYGCCTLAGRIPGLGKVRIVVSCEDVQLTGRSIVLGTNRADWDAAKIIRLYLNGGRRQRSLRTVKGPWASTSSACGVSTPLGHSGVWSSWPIRCCT